MEKRSAVKLGWTYAGVLFFATLAITIVSIIAAESTVQSGLFKPLGLSNNLIFLMAQGCFLILLGVLVLSGSRLRAYVVSKPASWKDDVFPAGSLVQGLWLIAAVLIPIVGADALFGELGLPDDRLVLSGVQNFAMGLLGLRFAAGYALSLPKASRTGSASSGNAA